MDDFFKVGVDNLDPPTLDDIKAKLSSFTFIRERLISFIIMCIILMVSITNNIESSSSVSLLLSSVALFMAYLIHLYQKRALLEKGCSTDIPLEEVKVLSFAITRSQHVFDYIEKLNIQGRKITRGEWKFLRIFYEKEVLRRLNDKITKNNV